MKRVVGARISYPARGGGIRQRFRGELPNGTATAAQKMGRHFISRNSGRARSSSAAPQALVWYALVFCFLRFGRGGRDRKLNPLSQVLSCQKRSTAALLPIGVKWCQIPGTAHVCYHLCKPRATLRHLGKSYTLAILRYLAGSRVPNLPPCSFLAGLACFAHPATGMEHARKAAGRNLLSVRPQDHRDALGRCRE